MDGSSKMLSRFEQNLGRGGQGWISSLSRSSDGRMQVKISGSP